MTVAPARPLRQIIATFVAEEADRNGGDVRITDLITIARELFATDEEIRDAFIRESLPVLVTEVAQTFFRDRRTSARARREPRTARFWAEHTFESVGGGVYRTIVNLTRPDAIHSREQRSQTVAGHLRWLGFLDEIIPLYPDDHTPLGEILSDAELQTIWDTHIT